MSKITVKPARVLLLAALICALWGSAASAQPCTDTDGDSACDPADAFPCDPQRAAVSWYPSETGRAMFSYEDQWPGPTDFDYNDAVVRANFRVETAANGAVKTLLAVIDPVALGGDLRSGLALRLPAARLLGGASNVLAARRIGPGAWLPLSAETTDMNVTVVLSPDLRELYSGSTMVGVPARINSSGMEQVGARLEVEITFITPALFSTGLPFPTDPAASTPLDLFIFRSNTAHPTRHEIHFPHFSGTPSMDTSLFRTLQDGSDRNGDGVFFVHNFGSPAALNLQDAQVFPSEGTDIALVFPTIVHFAASRGATHRSFFQSPDSNPANHAQRRSFSSATLPSRPVRCTLGLSAGSGTLAVAPLVGTSPGPCTALSVSNSTGAPLTPQLGFVGPNADRFQACTPSTGACSGALGHGANCNLGVQVIGTGAGTLAATAVVHGVVEGGAFTGSLTAIRPLSGSASTCSSAPQAFAPTGANQTLVVPSGCGTLSVKLWGAGGGGASAGAGGAGGAAFGSFPATPGESLTIIVGGGGGGHWHGGGGGGRSEIRRGTTSLIIAGGGGGASGGSFTNDGGGGGGLTGGNGTATSGRGGAGSGGSQTAGGSGGWGNSNGAAGTQYSGGNAGGGSGCGGFGGGGNSCHPSVHAGGGGGGGWWGGGGGGHRSDHLGTSGGGGGGGSGYLNAGAGVTGTLHAGGVGSAVGQSGDADRSGAGPGGCVNGCGGGGGRVVISFSN
jgi:LruC domain-containing protein